MQRQRFAFVEIKKLEPQFNDRGGTVYLEMIDASESRRPVTLMGETTSNSTECKVCYEQLALFIETFTPLRVTGLRDSEFQQFRVVLK